MNQRLWLILCLGVLAAGCAQRACPLRQSPTTAPVGYRVVGDHPLALQPLDGQKLSEAIRAVATPDATPNCVVLVRRCPEGVSRQIVDLLPDGSVANPQQDYLLRDGDEILMVSCPSPAPAGLERPTFARMSAAD